MTNAKEVQETDRLVVTYRRHHHSHPRDDPNTTFIDRSIELNSWQRFAQMLYSFIMVHYFLWLVPMSLFVWAVYRSAALAGAAALGEIAADKCGWAGVGVVLLMYLRTFFNGDELKRGRPWHAFRQHRIWDLIVSYLGVETIRTAKLDPAKQYIFGVYPHGILILSRVATYGGVWELMFPGIEVRTLAASPMFYVPGSREICLWMSAVNAAKRIAINCLKKHKLSLVVYPGGSAEIFETDPNSPATTLIARRGFVRLAIETGTAIVPSFVFGEKWLYHRRPVAAWIQHGLMRLLRLPVILFWGRYFTWLPYHDKEKAFLSVVFGKPIEVQQCDSPSEEQVEAVWKQYIEQTQQIYNEYKDKFGYPADEHLVIKDAESEKKKRKAQAQAAHETKKEK